MIKKFRILQRNLIRAVFNLPYNDQTISLLENNLILKLDDLYKFNMSISTINYMKNSINQRDFISSCLSFILTYHEYQTGMGSNLSVTRFNRTASQSSYIYQSINNWSTLPTNLKNITSSTSFRIKLKYHFCFQ